MKVKGRAVWTGRVNFYEPALMMPLLRKSPQIYFVNSLSDLFHVGVPTEAIDRIFATMALCPQHIFQVLTKRDARMRDYLRFPGVADRIRHAAARLASQLGRPVPGQAAWPLPNVWLGVSTEDQRWANARIPNLLHTPAAVRFISAEPLLGPIDLTRLDVVGATWLNALTGEMHGGPAVWQEFERPLDWVITGFESGKRARARHPDLARGLRDQCGAAGVPFYFKQWGEWAPEHLSNPSPRKVDRLYLDGCRQLARLGARSTGNLLDGQLHEAMPAILGESFQA
jgi:protein gp37